MVRSSLLRCGVALTWFIGGLSVATSAQAESASTTTAMQALDPDKDDTIDLAEAQKAAAVRFEALDPDHNGTLDMKEMALAGVAAAEFRKFDQDKDGTLDKTEFAALVKAHFKAADLDHDGTVSAKELGRSKGKSLLLLLR